ncbi:MAG: protein-disulfide reductase DsbD [Gammaproteobacteria bacterium]|nr:protein-disulfide reductase DsbD [Gammaproteobacteria bacterium]
MLQLTKMNSLYRIYRLVLILLCCVAPMQYANAVDTDLADRLKALSSELGLSNPSQTVLSPDEAFIFFAEADDGQTIRMQWQIADNIYMYRDKFRFAIIESTKGDVSLGAPQLPPGKKKYDESFGDSEVYFHEVTITLPVIREAGPAQTIKLQAYYQGCVEDSFCYPPIKKIISIDLPKLTKASFTAPGIDTANSNASETFVSEQDQLAATIANDSPWLIALIFFGLGLALAFTPCVFPMIPILSGIIIGQGKALTTRHAFILSLIYVLAMALTYTVIGILAGLFGANLQAAFQNPWIISGFVLVFIALSLSMFGFYELQIPAALQNKITKLSNSQKSGSFIGVAIMGVLSALIVGPCVAAPLAGALIYIGNSGDAVLGGLALFAMSLGMGMPLLAIGASAGKLLPKAGAWMDGIKTAFGIMLLAVAVWMLERIAPSMVTMLLWSLLFIFSAIYLGALDRLDKATGWQRFRKGCGIALLVYGCFVMLGAVSGGSDVTRPLHGVSFLAGTTQSNHALEFKTIKSVGDLQREVANASQNGTPVMLDFYADWCVSCKEMEKYTFSDPAVQQTLSKVLLLKADVTANDDIDQALMKHFSIPGPPSIMFYDAQGNERKSYRLVGFIKAEPFKQHVDQALSL